MVGLSVPSIALYWDPLIANNGHIHSRAPSPTLLPSTPEANNTQLNIDTLLTQYDNVHAYADSKHFIYRLYELSPAQALAIPHNKPILIVMAPDSTPGDMAIVRFAAFVTFNFASINVVLTKDQDLLSYSSCGVSNIFPTVLSDKAMAEIEQKSRILAQQVLLEEQSALVSSSLGDKNDALDLPKTHARRFMSALERFHYETVCSGFHDLIDRTKATQGMIDESWYSRVFHLSDDQISKVQRLVADWNFYAHDLNYDELMFAAFSMIKHGLSLPGVDDVKLSDVCLIKFLLLVRDSYRPSNPYHNFRHAIDVVQAIFYFLLQLGALPPFPLTEKASGTFDSILQPMETLTILIVAVGHDIGHPGVTNLFLTNSRSPIAEVFQYESVLESYHSAAFNEILKRYWPNIQNVPVYKLIATSVLATDMARHFTYMDEVNTFIIDPSSATQKAGPEYRTLICCLLIKCADISNVARRLDISSQWGQVLGKELAEVEALEIALGMKAPPAIPTVVSQPSTTSSKSDSLAESEETKLRGLAKGQIFFITTFAKPLFAAVCQLLPRLEFTLNILEENAESWASKLSPS